MMAKPVTLTVHETDDGIVIGLADGPREIVTMMTLADAKKLGSALIESAAAIEKRLARRRVANRPKPLTPN